MPGGTKQQGLARGVEALFDAVEARLGRTLTAGERAAAEIGHARGFDAETVAARLTKPVTPPGLPLVVDPKAGKIHHPGGREVRARGEAAPEAPKDNYVEILEDVPTEGAAPDPFRPWMRERDGRLELLDTEAAAPARAPREAPLTGKPPSSARTAATVGAGAAVTAGALAAAGSEPKRSTEPAKGDVAKRAEDLTKLSYSEEGPAEPPGAAPSTQEPDDKDEPTLPPDTKSLTDAFVDPKLLAAPAPPDYAKIRKDIGYDPEATPAAAENEVEYVDPKTGETRRATARQLIQHTAAYRIKETNQLMDEYAKEKDALRSRALWTEIVRGVAALAAGWYGLRHGVNMSGVRFDPIDWAAQQAQLRGELQAGLSATQDKAAALNQLADEAQQFDAKDFQREVQRMAGKERLYHEALRQADATYQHEERRYAEWVRQQTGAARLFEQTKARTLRDTKREQDAQTKLAQTLNTSFMKRAVSGADAGEAEQKIILAGMIDDNKRYHDITGEWLLEPKEFKKTTWWGKVWGSEPVMKSLEEVAETVAERRMQAADMIRITHPSAPGRVVEIPRSSLDALQKAAKDAGAPAYTVVE